MIVKITSTVVTKRWRRVHRHRQWEVEARRGTQTSHDNTVC